MSTVCKAPFTSQTHIKKALSTFFFTMKLERYYSQVIARICKLHFFIHYIQINRNTQQFGNVVRRDCLYWQGCQIVESLFWVYETFLFEHTAPSNILSFLLYFFLNFVLFCLIKIFVRVTTSWFSKVVICNKNKRLFANVKSLNFTVKVQ